LSKSGKIWSGIGIALIVAFAALIYLWQWNWFKPILESKLSSGTGQDIKIDGDLHGHIARITEFDVAGIVVTNPTWKGDPADSQLATIGTVKIQIDLAQLLKGHLSFPEIIVDKPVLTLHRVAVGQANWTPADNPDKPTKRGSIPEIGLLQIQDGILDYTDKVKNLALKGDISTIEGTNGQARENGGSGFTLKGKGTVQNEPLVIDASGGPLLDLTDTTKPYPLKIDVTLLHTHLKLEGAITDPEKLSGIDATLELQGPSLGDLFPLLNIPTPETPPYHIKGHLYRKPDAWEYEKFAGTVGGSDLDGSMEVQTGGPKLMIFGTLVSNKLDFKDIGPLIGIPPSQATHSEEQSEEQKRAKAAYDADPRILPNATLSLGKVRSVNADIDWKVDSVLAPNLPLDKVELHVILKDGILDLDPLNMDVAGGRIESRIQIDARQDQVVTDYDIRFKDFHLADFLAKAGFGDKGKGLLHGRVQLKAPGNSVRESLGNANGTIGLVMNSGEISDLAVAAIGIDIGEALKLVATNDKLIPIRCVATSFNVDNGLMQPQVFVIDTQSTLVTGTGNIDLKTEGLGIQLTAEQKTPTVLAAPTPIDIGGTFKHPAISLDTTALVERGAAAAALSVVLTPIGGLLAFIDPGLAKDSDCAKELQQVKDAPTLHPVQTAPVHK
jgi:uncharacterized protein involved in outer membrane biogenesis